LSIKTSSAWFKNSSAELVEKVPASPPTKAPPDAPNPSPGIPAKVPPPTPPNEAPNTSPTPPAIKGAKVLFRLFET